jgi:hypothetical protein
MTRILLLVPALLIAGCGLGETAVSSASGASAEVSEAQQAKRTEEHVKQQLDDAANTAKEQREAAERSAQ